MGLVGAAYRAQKTAKGKERGDSDGTPQKGKNDIDASDISSNKDDQRPKEPSLQQPTPEIIDLVSSSDEDDD